MKKGWKQIVLSAMMLTMLITVPTSAAEMPQRENVKQEETILLPSGTTYSKDATNGMARGQIIASVSSEIINEEHGDIGVVIDTLCHVECEQIRNIAILDRYNEETGQWVEQERHDFIANKEDFPNEPLTALINGFTIKNQETGYYYRIRGIHSVSTPAGKGQVSATRTDGILLTEYVG